MTSETKIDQFDAAELERMDMDPGAVQGLSRRSTTASSSSSASSATSRPSRRTSDGDTIGVDVPRDRIEVDRDDWTIYCDDCGLKVAEASPLPELGAHPPCPDCGSRARAFRYNGPNAGFSVLRSSAKKKPGEKRSPSESMSGDSISADTGRWVRVHRIIDRRRNRYYEKVLDPEAREVLREVDEPLTEHRGRGSAKRRAPSD